jgi:sigma-B regulation protein RsbU (phosphoserine phosphatase)
VSTRQRFEEFAAKFGEKARGGAPATGACAPQALGEDYWQSVRDLFTRDVTPKALRELFEHEPRETFRFFTRDVDLGTLKARPWYQRVPLAIWRVFLAMAYRLSPARRLVFAVGVPMLSLALLRYLTIKISVGEVPSWFGWTLLSALLLFGLLVLELRDKLTLKGDLEVARQIQFGLLPFEPYEQDGVAVRVAMRPANTVGGDYFDIVDMEPGRLGLVVGDVAGKGMPAALLMALLQGSLRTLITAGLRGDELIQKLNVHLCANIPSNRLITLFHGELQRSPGRLRYINAGHNAPFLLRRNGSVERLAATSVALGILQDAEFIAMETPFAKGDRLVLFTDGVTETFDAHDVEYGEERLAAYLSSHARLEAPQLIEGVLADVLAFAGPVRPRDDMTLMVVSRS